MDEAGEGGSKPVRRKQGSGKGPTRKRLARTQKPAPVSHLIRQLRETVFPNPDTQATKRQVLHRTKDYIHELENTLESLLKMREDTVPCSLDDVKEEYMHIYYNDLSIVEPSCGTRPESESAVWFLQREYDRGLPANEEESKPKQHQSPERSSQDLLEFERYLLFYKQTVDMLVENGVVTTEQITHPVVSKAISSLWQDLPQEGKADLYQYCRFQAGGTACSLPCPTDTNCPNGCVRDSGAESQEASSSFPSSTPEEILFEDAFDIATSFLDSSTVQNTSSPSSAYESPPWESPEGDSLLYGQIAGFLRACFCTQAKDTMLKYDYETVLLRCTETFDDEDDL
ncbi:stimulated by retinoic acid gene 8 protein homolog [Pelodytes ibericus]